MPLNLFYQISLIKSCHGQNINITAYFGNIMKHPVVAEGKNLGNKKRTDDDNKDFHLA